MTKIETERLYYFLIKILGQHRINTKIRIIQ